MLLKLGSKGEDVKKLQTRLGLKADGDFGKGTESAVIKFQKDNGLKADGVVGDGTWSKLFTTELPKSGQLNIYKLKGQIPDSVYSQIEETCQKFNITTNLRLAHFLAQCAHESGSFKAVSENLNYSVDGLKNIFGKYFPGDLANSYARNPEKIASRVYGGRMGNGDESTKEGWKFRGRGYLQCTGKSNYELLSKEIGVDLISNPDLVATDYPLYSAAWFFKKNKLWEICDRGDSNEVIISLTKRINGGTNGITDRINKFKKYYNLLK